MKKQFFKTTFLSILLLISCLSSSILIYAEEAPTTCDVPDSIITTIDEAEIKATDKSLLEASILEAKKIDVNNYRPDDSWAYFVDALLEAEQVLENENATQEEIDAAIDLLNYTISSLTPIPDVDKSALQGTYLDVYTYIEEEFTPESWKPFPEALAFAKAVLDDENATQEDVDAASKMLNDALCGLVLKEDIDTPVPPKTNNPPKVTEKAASPSTSNVPVTADTNLALMYFVLLVLCTTTIICNSKKIFKRA